MPLAARLLLSLACALVCSIDGAGAADDPAVAIVGGTVIHPERPLAEAAVPNTTVIVSGNRIQSVVPSESASIPSHATVIDASGKWIIPGLIDSHVHFFQSGNLYTRPDVADFTQWISFAQETARNRARLPVTFKVWIASGVTGVVDVGGPLWNFEVRDAAKRSRAAPRVAVAGPLVSTVARPQLDLGDPPIIKVTTPEQARALVERELLHQPDYIKVWFIHRHGDDLAQQEAIVKAAGEAAHAGGVRFAVHATELAAAKAALRAGADFLVHSVEDEPIDDEFLTLAHRRNVLYCPTLFVMDGYGLALSNRWNATDAESRLADPQVLAAMHDLNIIPKDKMPAWVARMIRDGSDIHVSQVALDNLRRVWDAGITVVMGTDAGNIGTLHGPSVYREMELMQQAGLTPSQVLRSATTNAAKTMGLDGEVGVIARGKLADLIILDANPLDKIGNVSRIHKVIKDGEVYDPQELLRSIR